MEMRHIVPPPQAGPFPLLAAPILRQTQDILAEKTGLIGK